MNIKAVFFDIDGTLMVTKTQSVPQSAIDAIYKLKEKGIQVFIATSRCDGEFGNFLDHLHALPFDGIISCGGGLLHYHDDVFVEAIDDEDSKAIIEYCAKHDIDIRYQSDSICALTTNPKPWVYDSFIKFYNYCPDTKPYEGEHVVNFLGFDGGKHFEKIMALTKNVDGIKYIDAFEMTRKHISKASGIIDMCKHLNIDVCDTMAFGDAENDCRMLETAGIGIAMGNAMDIAKKSADYVTTNAEDDGIANALMHYGLI